MSRRTAMLKAAQGLFGRFGLKKVTMEEIAKAAAVSKVTLYKVFPNKEAVFEAVVRLEADGMLDAIRRAVAAETDVASRFKAHLLTKFGLVHDLVNFYHMSDRAMQEHWPTIETVAGHFMREERAIVEGILRDGVHRGEVAVKDPEEAAQVMVLALKSLEYGYVSHMASDEMERFAELLIDMLIHGLKPREAVDSAVVEPAAEDERTGEEGAEDDRAAAGGADTRRGHSEHAEDDVLASMRTGG